MLIKKMSSLNYQSMSSEVQEQRWNENSKLISQQQRNANDTNYDHESATRSTPIADDDHHDDDYRDDFANLLSRQMRKYPVFIFGTIILLSCTVGHTLTLMYYWDHIKHGTNNTADIERVLPKTTSASLKGSVTNEIIKEMQHLADTQKKDELDVPSLESWNYFNNQDSEFPIMGKSESDLEASSHSPPPPDGCEGTVMIIRHCEKGSVREHCDPVGFERADYVATLFGNGDERWPAPSKLYALAPGARNNDIVENHREVETITPLSVKLNTTINVSYGMDHRKELANELFGYIRSGRVCGKTVLISWKHSKIPHLAHSLGCGPNQGCPTAWDDDYDFDSAWQIKYTYDKEKYSPYPAAEKKKKKKKEHKWGKHPEWQIYGSVQKEGFDPLAFSKKDHSY
mmetsp:Transcript_23579/g.28998  ORF Transcript_23579/g.28998 Transcript_23579/m.28998 type:complete len:400 (-) Transcript_23579:2869-4068(-)